MKPYRENPHLKEIVDLAGGIKDLAEFCAHCINRYGTPRYEDYVFRPGCDVDEDSFYTGVSEEVFTALEAEDIDPRKTLRNRELIKNYAFSDPMRLYLELFFEQHAYKYRQLLGEMLFYDLEPRNCTHSDAIALLITPP